MDSSCTPEPEGSPKARQRATPDVVAKQMISPIRYSATMLGYGARDEHQFCHDVRSFFEPGVNMIPLGRARTGIYLLVKSCITASRRNILLSPYTISDVVKMVEFAGGVPVFVDFEPGTTLFNLDQLESSIDDNTAAVLVTHYHVNDYRLPQIKEICSSRDIALFDDCAIVFGGTIDGRSFPSITDASVFSFSYFKLLNYFWGGAVATGSAEIESFISDEIRDWPTLGLKDYLGQMKGCLTYDLATRPWVFRKVTFPYLSRRSDGQETAATLEHVRRESVKLERSHFSRPSPAAYAEWCRKLPWIEDWLNQRRAVAHIYRQALGEVMVTSRINEAHFAESCFVNFPILAPEGRRDEIHKAIIQNGFDVGKSLYPNAHEEPQYRTVAGTSDNVRQLVRDTIYLPTHSGVSEGYALALAGCVQELI